MSNFVGDIWSRNVKDKSRHMRARSEYMTLILIRLLSVFLLLV